MSLYPCFSYRKNTQRYSTILDVAFKIASWNVAGLRALLRKTPNALSDLVNKYDLDVLCLQETKLQESHLDDPKLKLNGGNLIEGYDAYWSCSTAKKGYAGTAVFIKLRGTAQKKQAKMGDFFASNKNATSKVEATICTDLDSVMIQKLVPTNVSYKMGKEAHDTEGRIITLDFPTFSLSNVYVPNSGKKLERLTYRTQQWDKDLLSFMQTKQSDRGGPVILLGDLNVAHTNLDVWNDGAQHLAKQAGTTPEERQSFQDMLDSGFVDAFRKLHPTAQGHYSYWSQRAGNRQPNKGLRLDVS
jgi:exonuclease III